MSSKLPQTSRSVIAILLVVVFSLVLACGSESVAATPVPNTPAAAASPSTTIPDPTEPPLVNTPGPVSNIAPDFKLPSIQGAEYTLSQFRGEQPVVVVFYRAYW
ncbi:MAG: redoxin domain-containing protein [Chloroflexi bacterium]|nr:redoxin domain-containing protein [Chloroflexota bacterium]